MNQKQLYFLCTGNACRSQMAEGWAKQILGTEWRVLSAGIEAHGVNPTAIQVMHEIGIDISQQSSSIVNEHILHNATLVVTLCADADENCPYIPPHIQKVHWGFDDPAGQSIDVFRRVRDEIGQKIQAFARQTN